MVNLLLTLSARAGLQRFIAVNSPLISRSIFYSSRHSRNLSNCCRKHSFSVTKLEISSQRRYASASNGLVCQLLTHRRLIRVTGSDTLNYLQGLITNDVLLFNASSDLHAMYAMMLNVQGRTLYDLILFKLPASDTPSILIECNDNIASDLIKLLARYKLRQKITMSDVANEMSVWAVFSRVLNQSTNETPPLSFKNKEKVILSAPDPRLPGFGHRLLLPAGVLGSSVIADCPDVTDGYDVRRYQLGLGEGTTDLPPGQCFPLECNLAFLNGVSFDKGCYIGQELTARTHHTGVIRKRLMPMIFSSPDAKIKTDSAVENSTGKACGKVRSVSGRHGLGLLRVAEVATTTTALTIREGTEKIGEAQTFIPTWWASGTDEIIKKTLAKGSERESDPD